MLKSKLAAKSSHVLQHNPSNNGHGGARPTRRLWAQESTCRSEINRGAGKKGRGARSAATNHRREGCRAEEDLGRGKPALILWQAGTFDAISGIDPEEFRTSLTEGVDTINTAGADV